MTRKVRGNDEQHARWSADDARTSSKLGVIARLDRATQ
jgi:hypothetical protein